MTGSSKTGKERFTEELVRCVRAQVPNLEDLASGADPDTRRHLDVLLAFQEISRTLEAIQIAGTLARRAPPRGTGIKKPEYLRFVIGAYLQEVYILRERLITFAVKMERMYKPTGTVATQLKALPKLVEDAFDHMTSHRGSHVHDRRYDDEELVAMSGNILIADNGSELSKVERFAFTRAARSSQRKQTEKWAANIAETVENLSPLLDHYYTTLLTAATASGSFHIPAAPSQSTPSQRYVRGAKSR